MPRTAKSKKGHKKKPDSKGKKSVSAVNGSGDQNPKYTLQDVLEKAQSSIDVYDYDMAQRYCQKALEIDNENIKVLEMTGHVMMEVGNVDAARQCYGRSVELEPDSGHLKYLYLAQLLDGLEALDCYKKAIEVMLNTIEAQENKSAEAATSETVGTATEPTAKDVSSAYLSIAELYMTDLCDEAEAEEACTSSIKKAMDHDLTNPEVYQVLADYHLIKGEMEEAKTQINKSISLWLPNAKSLVADEQELEGASCDTINDPIDCFPITPDAQLKAAKTLIEVEEYNSATDVLELLLDQDDTVVDVWYLIGWANYLQGDDFKQTSKYYLERCKGVSEKTKYEDKDVLLHVSELLEELSSLPEQDEATENLPSDQEEEMEAD